MHHRIPVLALAIVFVSTIVGADLGASSSSGRLQGLVRDGLGLAIADASILAVGNSIVSARSDASGRFQMALPPGEYILKAARAGYISTYREPVRVAGSHTLLERTITLMRQAETLTALAIDSHSHTDLAWRLRHLPSSVLRDEGAASPAGGSWGGNPDTRSRTGSILHRAIDSSARVATSFLADNELTGQVNFLTTASASMAGLSGTAAMPRSVAFIVVGAPIGPHADWRVRGAIASGAGSSWNLLGEYESRDVSDHELGFGASFSAHDYQSRSTGRLPAAVAEARSVAGVSARDRWRLLPDVELTYGARVDRYDYLEAPNLFTANTAVRARVFNATYVEAELARSMVAPGAAEFLPPPADGQWLPPERTFSSLNPNELLRAEDVRHAEIGVSREFGSTIHGRRISLRAFSQQTHDQAATLFGSGTAASLGHYRVAYVGSVVLNGWAIGLSGRILGPVSGRFEYARVHADWQQTPFARRVRRTAPSVLRPDLESLHDFLATLDADFERSHTRVSAVVRSASAFSSDTGGAAPQPGVRFDVQLHQALPYRPTREGRLELMFAVRTLFRDLRSGDSMYDELLTVRPPVRLMGGIQVRF